MICIALRIPECHDGMQVQAGIAQDQQSASTGAVDDSFPSPEVVGEAGAELAQKLGIPLEQALDQVVSTVLQQRAGGLSVAILCDEGPV